MMSIDPNLSNNPQISSYGQNEISSVSTKEVNNTSNVKQNPTAFFTKMIDSIKTAWRSFSSLFSSGKQRNVTTSSPMGMGELDAEGKNLTRQIKNKLSGSDGSFNKVNEMPDGPEKDATLEKFYATRDSFDAQPKMQYNHGEASKSQHVENKAFAQSQVSLKDIQGAIATLGAKKGTVSTTPASDAKISTSQEKTGEINKPKSGVSESQQEGIGKLKINFSNKWAIKSFLSKQEKFLAQLHTKADYESALDQLNAKEAKHKKRFDWDTQTDLKKLKDVIKDRIEDFTPPEKLQGPQGELIDTFNNFFEKCMKQPENVKGNVDGLLKIEETIRDIVTERNTTNDLENSVKMLQQISRTIRRSMSPEMVASMNDNTPPSQMSTDAYKNKFQMQVPIAISRLESQIGLLLKESLSLSRNIESAEDPAQKEKFSNKLSGFKAELNKIFDTQIRTLNLFSKLAPQVDVEQKTVSGVPLNPDGFATLREVGDLYQATLIGEFHKNIDKTDSLRELSDNMVNFLCEVAPRDKKELVHYVDAMVAGVQTKRPYLADVLDDVKKMADRIGESMSKINDMYNEGGLDADSYANFLRQNFQGIMQNLARR